MQLQEKFVISAIEVHNLGVFSPEMGHDRKMCVDLKLLEPTIDALDGARSDPLDYFADTV